MKIFDNVTEIVRDDMAETIKKGSKLAIAASCFSIYAYQELKSQLEQIDELRFIFTSPTFTTEKAKKARIKEFKIEKRKMMWYNCPITKKGGNYYAAMYSDPRFERYGSRFANV